MRKPPTSTAWAENPIGVDETLNRELFCGFEKSDEGEKEAAENRKILTPDSCTA